MNPLKKNDEGSDDPEYDPKFHHYWKQLQKLFLLLWKTIVWTLCPLSKYHEWPFKSTLQISTSTSKNENKIYVHCFVKVNVSKKATQIDKIFTVYLTFTTWCQIIGEDFITLCGLLRKNELYPTSFNEWSLLSFFREKSILHTDYEKLLQPWVYPWSFPQEESSHLQDSNQIMCEKSDPVLFWWLKHIKCLPFFSAMIIW